MTSIASFGRYTASSFNCFLVLGARCARCGRDRANNIALP